MTRQIVIEGCIVILLLCAGGTYQRNRAWLSEETLWRDVTEKSPLNGRGWMNYGLAIMQRGDLAGAQSAFEHARSLMPNYYFLEINLGIVAAAQKHDSEAERHYLRAIELSRNGIPALWYGRFLHSRGRVSEALKQFSIVAQTNPDLLRAQQ